MRESEFEFIRNLVYQRSRICLDAGKREMVSARLGKRLRENVLVIDDQPLRMTVSLGISPMRPGDRHPEEALQRADAALYQAKRDGRDRAALAP